MASWGEVEVAQPEFAAAVRRRFEAGRHKTIATIRADGSPRISGLECSFETGQLTFGSMLHSRKLDDLLRDPRIAIHSPTHSPIEGSEHTWGGEAKLAGTAVPVGGGVGHDDKEGARFRVEISDVVLVHLDETASALVVQWWTPTQGMRRVERE